MPKGSSKMWALGLNWRLLPLTVIFISCFYLQYTLDLTFLIKYCVSDWKKNRKKEFFYMYKQYLFTIFDWFVLLLMNFLKNKFELDFTFSKIGWSYFKYLETTSKGPYICMFFPCLSVKILDRTSPMDLLQIFRN